MVMTDEDSITNNDFCINTNNVEEKDGTDGTGKRAANLPLILNQNMLRLMSME